jgi:rhodanese-related sulfurtransferase
MLNRVNLFLAVSCLSVLAGCDWFSKKESAAPASTDMQQGAMVRVVNVLDDKLFNDAHIKGSVHVDFAKVKDAAANWNKEDSIVFYCSNAMCKASFEAAKQLKEMGFNNAMAYEGGMEEWNRLSKGDASYVVEGAAQEAYLSTPVEKPVLAEEAGVKVVSAEELRNMMKQANLL